MSQITLRHIAVASAVALAVGVPGLVMGLHLGLDQASFAAQGDTTLRAAPYAFAIWGLIYVGLLAYAVYQWGRRSPTLGAFGWPSAIAVACCAGWIVTTAANLQWTSVAVILIGAGASAWPLMSGRPAPTGRERWLVVWPNAFLSGWLTLAAALAVLTVLTAQRWIVPGVALPWAIGGLAAVTVIGAAIALRSGLVVYLVPIVWGLLAVAADDRHSDNAIPALAAAAILAVVALLNAFVWPDPRRADERTAGSYRTSHFMPSQGD